MRFATAANMRGDLSADERLVTDLITACEAVVAALDRLPPL